MIIAFQRFTQLTCTTIDTTPTESDFLYEFILQSSILEHANCHLREKSMRIISSTKNPQHNDLRVIDHRRFC
jgi:hypothetical protein